MVRFCRHEILTTDLSEPEASATVCRPHSVFATGASPGGSFRQLFSCDIPLCPP